MEEFKRMLEQAGAELGLRNARAYADQQNTGLALRWTNDDGKSEQVMIFQENIMSRGEEVTVETLKTEVSRKIESSVTQIMD
jgi:hypothetical protein